MWMELENGVPRDFPLKTKASLSEPSASSNSHPSRKRLEQALFSFVNYFKSPWCFVSRFQQPKSVLVLPSGNFTPATTCTLLFGSMMATGTSNL